MNAAAIRPNVSQDAWDRHANSLLLDYVRTRLGRTPRAWGDFDRVGYGDGRGETVQATSTRIAVSLKNRWRDEMAARPDFPPLADQRESWEGYLAIAEEHITAWLSSGIRPDWLGLQL